MKVDCTHTLENNPESQAHLEQHRKKFNAECYKVLDLLLTHGLRLTVRSAMLDYDVSSLPRRVKDLTDWFGLPIHATWATVDGKRMSYKEYYIKPEDVDRCLEIIKAKVKK